MKLATRCIPFETLPYDTIEPATRMTAKLFEKMPFIAILPKCNAEDSLLDRTLKNIPGIRIKDSKLVFKSSSAHFKQDLLKLDVAYNKPTKENLAPYAIDAYFLEKYLQIIKKFKSPNAYINILGPFTISQLLMNAADEQILADKSFRKLFIQAVCVKALWIADKIREYNPNVKPIVMLEEPLLGRVGEVKRENEEITVELITNMFAKVVEKLKENDIVVGVQCMEKCDWKIPINAGVDIISFDAYNNPNNLCIIPELITEFLERGGKINWGIVPVMTESVVKALNVDYIAKRLFATMEGLILAGVSEKLVYNSALVSVQGQVDKLPVIFAEKAIILATQLAKKIPVKS